jgi:hypothetical protein
MTSLPPDDPFVALWQTAPKPDTEHLMQDLQRLKQLHRRLNRSVLTILCGVALLLIFEEATGRVATHGALSVVYILVVSLDVVVRRRARCNRADALTLDTVSLLRSMIARARKDLNVARCLYAGVPAGALVSGLVAKLAGLGTSKSASAVHETLHAIQTAAGVAVLLAMIVTGIVLARARSLQVTQLSEKLRAVEEDR